MSEVSLLFSGEYVLTRFASVWSLWGESFYFGIIVLDGIESQVIVLVLTLPLKESQLSNWLPK